MQAPSRASSTSSRDYLPALGRAESRASRADGLRSTRQSKRYSVTALYLSMNANQRDLEIEDDLAKGPLRYLIACPPANRLTDHYSPESPPRAQIQDLVTIKEEFRTRKGCQISRFAHCAACAESHGAGRSRSSSGASIATTRTYKLTIHSATKSPKHWMSRPNLQKVLSQMTRRHRDTVTCCSYSSQSLSTLLIFAVL